MSAINLVPRVNPNVCQESTTTAPETGSSQKSGQKEPPTNSGQLSKARGLDLLKERLHAEGISKRATTLLTSCRRTSSFKHYQSAWDKWVSWCSKRKVCPTRCDAGYILDFLAELFESGLQYRIIGSHRSVIYAFYDRVGDINMGNHPRVLTLRTRYLIRDLQNQDTQLFGM